MGANSSDFFSMQALKIQYLRLIHNFCDRDSCNRANKQLLLLPPTFPVKVRGNSCSKGPSVIAILGVILLLVQFGISGDKFRLEIEVYTVILMVQDSSSWLGNANAEQKESDGLMGKILGILVNEPADSLYRFIFLHLLATTFGLDIGSIYCLFSVVDTKYHCQTELNRVVQPGSGWPHASKPSCEVQITRIR